MITLNDGVLLILLNTQLNGAKWIRVEGGGCSLHGMRVCVQGVQVRTTRDLGLSNIAMNGSKHTHKTAF